MGLGLLIKYYKFTTSLKSSESIVRKKSGPSIRIGRILKELCALQIWIELARILFERFEFEIQNMRFLISKKLRHPRMIAFSWLILKACLAV